MVLFRAQSQINNLPFIFDDPSDMRETNEIKLHLMDHEKLIYGHIISLQTPELVQQSFMFGNNAAQFQRSNGEHPGIKTFSKGGILKKKKSTCKQRGKCSCDCESSSKSSLQQTLFVVFFLFLNFLRVSKLSREFFPD